MRLKAVILKLNQPDEDGEVITREAMEKALKKFKAPKDIGYEFNPEVPWVGFAREFSIDDENNLIADIEIQKNERFGETLSVAPSYHVLESEDDGEGHRIINKLTLISISLVKNPKDDSVTKFNL